MAISKREQSEPVVCNRKNVNPGTKKDKTGKKITVNSDKTEIDINELYWEQLIEEKNKTIDVMISSQGLIAGLVNSLEGKVEILDPYNEVLVGLFRSFEDISKLLRKNMECHVKFDNDNKIIDYKRGRIASDSDEFVDYLKISGNYVFAEEQISDLTYKAYGDIISKIRESAEFDKLDQKTKDGIIEYDIMVNRIDDMAKKEKTDEDVGEDNGTNKQQ